MNLLISILSLLDTCSLFKLDWFNFDVAFDDNFTWCYKLPIIYSCVDYTVQFNAIYLIWAKIQT